MDIKNTIIGVVPQLGTTFPYSEFSGFSKFPRLVTNPLSSNCVGFILIFLDVAINFKKEE
jgi:hypothetical protein